VEIEMDKHRLKGTARSVLGKIKEILGKVTGDKTMRAEGKKDQATGKLQGTYGRVKDAVKK
jgi:uncharacterized protein YjbJ (UPF0337 family)